MTEYVRKKGSRESIDIVDGQGTTMQVLISADEAPNFAFRKFVMEPHGGMPKHIDDRESPSDRFMQPVDRLHDEQRMSTEVKERIVDANLVDLKDLLPHPGD